MLRKVNFLWLICFCVPSFQIEIRLSKTLRELKFKDDATASLPTQNDLFPGQPEIGVISDCGEKDSNCGLNSIPEKLELPEEIQAPDTLQIAEELDSHNQFVADDTDAANLGLDHFHPNKTLEELQNINMTIEPRETTTEKMDEIIMLPRNNCNMEIHVNELEDRKLRIYFGPLENGAVGQCQITLNGDEKSMLAVLLTEVKLYRTGNDEKNCLGDETLRVVIANTGINFTMKQYCGEEDHYPVLLTETNRVYLILTYNNRGTVQEIQESSFSLEVFTYEKNQNNITAENESLFYSSSGQDVENIFFTTDTPVEKQELQKLKDE